MYTNDWGPWHIFQLDLLRTAWMILPASLLWGASFPLAIAAIAGVALPWVERGNRRPLLDFGLFSSHDFLIACRDLAREYDVGIHSHVAESKVQVVAGYKRYGTSLAAHMDEVGLMVKTITKDGFIQFSKMGGIDDRILPAQKVTVYTKKGTYPGIIGSKPPHIQAPHVPLRVGHVGERGRQRDEQDRRERRGRWNGEEEHPAPPARPRGPRRLLHLRHRRGVHVLEELLPFPLHARDARLAGLARADVRLELRAVAVEQVAFEGEVGRTSRGHVSLRVTYFRAFSRNLSSLRATVRRDTPRAAATSSCSMPSTMTPTATAWVAASKRDSTGPRQAPAFAAPSFARQIARAPASIARNAVGILRLRTRGGPLRLVTLSASQAVETTIAAVAEGLTVVACCAEGRPQLEGRDLAGRLAARGLRVEVYTDAAIGVALESAEALLVGADAVGPDRFINKVGTAALCALAGVVGVPVYVLAGREKVLAREDLAALERGGGPPDEVWRDAPAGVTALNPYFEEVPRSLASALITDSGVI